MTTTWRRDPEVMHTELEPGSVLLDPRTQRIFDLNQTGTVVWASLDDGLDAVIERLVTTFAVDEAAARHDVSLLVARLADAGLVIRGD